MAYTVQRDPAAPNSARVSNTQGQINFADGTRTGGSGEMALIVFEDHSSVLATPDQPFVLANGKLKLADALMAGDSLLKADGQTTRVAVIQMSPIEQGIFHIGLDDSNTNQFQKHFINVEGVLAGDFYVQIYFDQLPAEFKDSSSFGAKPVSHPYFNEYMR